jgi:Methane oxygenase PmoA
VSAMKRLLSLAIALIPSLAFAQTLTVTGGKADAVNVVVQSDEKLPGNRAVFGGPKGSWIQPSGKGSLFIVPSLKAGETLEYKFIQVKREPPTLFKFQETAGEHVDVIYGDRTVLRYMNKPRDGTTKDTHELSFKPFHHVFDPKTGEKLLTNGAGLAANKDLLFPHHRGLFFAFNRINTGDKQDSDTWHGRNGEYTLHEKMLNTEAGEVFARHRALLTWHGRDGKTFATEERELTAYNVLGGTMIDFVSELKTDRPKVRLDGDPQHAGFHFRANMEVSKNGKANTYYLRPDGKGKVGETRNWDAKGKNPATVNLPWNALSFVTGEQRYTVLRINHPDNPKETRGSERDYGRFGDYFEYDLTPEKPLKLKYRVWIQEGEMTGEQCEKLAAGFAQTPTVKFAK